MPIVIDFPPVTKPVTASLLQINAGEVRPLAAECLRCGAEMIGHAAADGRMCVNCMSAPAMHRAATPELVHSPRGFRTDQLWRRYFSKSVPSAAVSATATPVVCAMCADEFIPTRADAKFCGPACRQSAYRKRIREVGS